MGIDARSTGCRGGGESARWIYFLFVGIIIDIVFSTKSAYL